MKRILPVAAAFVMSCNTTANEHNAATAVPQTLEDSLYKEVIGYHDEAMPKMGKLQGYQKALQAKIDSLDKLAGSKKDATVQILEKNYRRLQENLKTAEQEMNNWMDSFEPDPKFPTKEELEKYWRNQQQKARQMRDDILSSIDSAKTVIKN